MGRVYTHLQRTLKFTRTSEQRVHGFADVSEATCHWANFQGQDVSHQAIWAYKQCTVRSSQKDLSVPVIARHYGVLQDEAQHACLTVAERSTYMNLIFVA